MAPDAIDLAQLDRRIDELIRVVQRLRDENRSLRQSQASLTAERARLIEKKEEADRRIEAMVSRLRALEQDL